MDRTSFFRQCVDIYTNELSDDVVIEKVDSLQNEQSKFMKTAKSMYMSIIGISELIEDIKHEYLIPNSTSMSDASKLRVNAEIKQQLQYITMQISRFQKEVVKLDEFDVDSSELGAALVRLGVSETKEVSKLDTLTRNLVSFGDYAEYVSIKNATLRTIFKQVIKGLGMKLQVVGDEWNRVFERRNEQVLQLKKSRIQTPKWEGRRTTYDEDESGDGRFVDEEFEQLGSSMPMDEMVQLQEEQNDLVLEMKKGTIEQVEQIESQIGDVANIVSEISVQLSLQNNNISILHDLKDDILVNVKSGNKELLHSKNNNKNTMAILIFSLSLILLVIDYIL